MIAPVFVGDPAAPRIAAAAGAPGGRMHLAEVQPVGDVVLLRYLPGRPAERPRHCFR